jgi:hypothetical protein
LVVPSVFSNVSIARCVQIIPCIFSIYYTL